MALRGLRPTGRFQCSLKMNTTLDSKLKHPQVGDTKIASLENDNPFKSNDGPTPKVPIRMKLIFGFLVLLALVGVIFAGLLSIPASCSYQVTAMAKTLPPDENAFESWIKNQPGVVDHTVNVHRTDSNKITITFIMTRNGWGYPRFPDLETASAGFGYDIGENHFADVRR